MMLKSYWPQATAVNACIKNEAETADVSVLLAVHQPSPLVQRNAGTNLTTPATEKDLLEAFLTNDVPGGALVVPITGPSGVGKSHIIRWLDAQLQRSSKREQLHIIRIPKSASLRTVVELILAPLADDPRYAKPSADLTRAVAEVNIKDAVITFRAHLENALSARRDRMIAELREHPDRTHLKALIGHADKLPRLFSDAALDQHFIKQVLTRVVTRAISGRSDSETNDDSLSQFTAEDLMLPREIDLNQAARQVREYYQVQIAIAPPERLKPVVDLLNEAVDPAIANVFQLEQSTGGMTLQDIILAVRKILFEDGRDLVLLIEDFQALAGIQDVLLKVCIQEGEYEGKKVRATMRTAIALTDGYLAFRDTILTRARREWVIGGQAQSDDEIKAGVVEMVGAYLNAARWGEHELRRLFQQRGPEQSVTDWLPAWRNDDLGDEGSKAVAAFGFNAKGVSLFPFNRYAIEQLAERHLSEGGRLIFNPRRVINEILRHALLMRQSYESHGFPPPDFQDFRPNATIANWIRQSHQVEQVGRRLATLLAVWGGNPLDVAAIGRIPPEIFTTFDLPTPAELANIPFVPEPPRTTSSTTSPETNDTSKPGRQSASPTAVDPEMEKWRAKLEAWAGGLQLGQKEANDVRSALLAMMKDAMNWPSLRIREPYLRASWITIPNARGNPQSGRQLNLCSDHLDEDGTVRKGILGAIRFTKEKRWTYPEADDDYVAGAALVDHLLAQMTPLLIDDAKAEAAALARTLITQSRIAGLSPPIRPTGADATLTALFARPEPKERHAFEDNWDKLRDSALGPIGAKPARDVLQSELLDRVASFQGTGGRAFAVDIARLLDVVAGDSAIPEAIDRLPEDVKAFMRPISDGRLWGQLTQVIAKLRDFRTQVSDFLDESFDKAKFVSDLQEIIRLLAATGSFPPDWSTSPRDFERRLTEFQASPIVDLVTTVATIVDDPDREQIPKLLNALGSLEVGLIDRTMDFLSSANTLIATADRSVAREEADRSQADPEALCREISDLLGLVAGSVQTVEAVQ